MTGMGDIFRAVGEGSPFLGIREKKGGYQPTIVSTKPKIPIVAKIPAGEPEQIPDLLTDDDIIDWAWIPDDVERRILVGKKKAWGIVVKGDCMTSESRKSLHDDDYALVVPSATAENGDIVVAQVNGEDEIREFVKKDDHKCMVNLGKVKKIFQKSHFIIKFTKLFYGKIQHFSSKPLPVIGIKNLFFYFIP